MDYIRRRLALILEIATNYPNMIFILILLIVSSVSSADEEYPCGIPSKHVIIEGELNNRIRGGQDARPHSLPWQVRLFIEDPSDGGRNFCGGSLVNSGHSNGTDLIITAAHCFEVDDYEEEFVKPKHIRVIIGAHDFRQKEPSRHRMHVNSLVIHECYDSDSVDNDIAFLRLKKMIPYTDEIRPICLPRHEQQLPYGVTCVSSGWGRLHEDGERSPVLQMNAVQIVPSGECSFSHDPQKHFCIKGQGDICDGDSGGPLACPIDGKYTLFGIASYGNDECTNSMFTRVPNYVKWYETNKKKMGTSENSAAVEA